MKNTFKNFLSERNEYEPPENGGGDFGGGDEWDGHIDEWIKHFGDAMSTIPFVHNTKEGTHKWENLGHAMKAHASEAAHSSLYLSAPKELGQFGEDLRTLGGNLGNSNMAMQSQLKPHVVRAIRMAQSRLDDNNPFKSFDPSDLAEKEFEKHHNAAIMHIAITARHNNVTAPQYAVEVAPQIAATLERHGPHGFMLKGGHFGMLSNGEDEARPKFFPKWGPDNN